METLSPKGGQDFLVAFLSAQCVLAPLGRTVRLCLLNAALCVALYDSGLNIIIINCWCERYCILTARGVVAPRESHRTVSEAQHEADRRNHFDLGLY